MLSMIPLSPELCRPNPGVHIWALGNKASRHENEAIWCCDESITARQGQEQHGEDKGRLTTGGFRLGESNAVVTVVEHGVVLAHEDVAEDPESLRGSGHVHAHQSGEATVLLPDEVLVLSELKLVPADVELQNRVVRPLAVTRAVGVLVQEVLVDHVDHVRGPREKRGSAVGNCYAAILAEVDLLVCSSAHEVHAGSFLQQGRLQGVDSTPGKRHVFDVESPVGLRAQGNPAHVALETVLVQPSEHEVARLLCFVVAQVEGEERVAVCLFVAVPVQVLQLVLVGDDIEHRRNVVFGNGLEGKAKDSREFEAAESLGFGRESNFLTLELETAPFHSLVTDIALAFTGSVLDGVLLALGLCERVGFGSHVVGLGAFGFLV
mmetsp:Transcript_13642/g.26043  ORF Transcript_13642/g.26043 Transcript_13642/m.26043 type:complete len:378 (-) Transcript_13642:393-1526(-)